MKKTTKDPIIIKEAEHRWYCKCLYCGKEFWGYKGNGIPKYCSSQCHSKDSKIIIEKNCAYCGKKIIVGAKHKNKKFCDIYCASKHRSEQGEHHVWIGNDGYKHLCIGGRTLKEHVYIMEQHLGRRLKKNEVVHHKDFSRTNNDFSNLQLMTRGEHSKLHREHELKNRKALFGGHNSEKTERGYVPWNAKGVICIETQETFESTKECANRYGITASCVRKLCMGEKENHNGLHFRYLEEGNANK